MWILRPCYLDESAISCLYWTTGETRYPVDTVEHGPGQHSGVRSKCDRLMTEDRV